jgi:hypothetical protein
MAEQQLRFMEFASPWIFNPGTVRLPSPPQGLSTCEVRRRLLQGELPQQPLILETSSERCLYFTQGNLQSVMSLEAPDALIAAYTRKMLLSQPARSSDHRSGSRCASGRPAR